LTVSADVTAEEWDGYVARHARARVCHLWAWRRVFESAFGYQTEYLVARGADGRIAGILPLVVVSHWLSGRVMVSLPYVHGGGLLADSDAIATALVHEAGDRAEWDGCAYVEFRHRTPQFRNLYTRAHADAMVLALPGQVDDLWRRIAPVLRDQVSAAGRKGLVVETGGSELVATFYPVFAGSTRDRGILGRPAEWFSEILEHFPDRARVYLVRHGDDVVGGAVTLAFGPALQVLGAASLTPGGADDVMSLLHWRIAVAGIEAGTHEFEMTHLLPGDDPGPYWPLWGAEARTTMSEFVRFSRRRKPLDRSRRSWIHGARAMWRRLPIQIVTAIGPGLSRHLP
jgi:hypothetical protein